MKIITIDDVNEELARAERCERAIETCEGPCFHLFLERNRALDRAIELEKSIGLRAGLGRTQSEYSRIGYPYNQ